MACTNADGYGMFDGPWRSRLTHRIAWEMHNGSIPDGVLVLHKCDTPSCVRVDHLFLGTDADNARDRDRKRRRILKLTPEKADEIRKLLASTTLTQTEIAHRFGVSPALVSNINGGTMWSPAKWRQENPSNGRKKRRSPSFVKSAK